MSGSLLPNSALPADRQGAASRAVDPRVFFPILSVLLFVPILTALYWPAGNGLDVTGHQIGRDFINVWIGPQLALKGQIATLFDLKAYQVALTTLFGQPLPFHAWSYPLFTLLAFWPLAQLPYFAALALWTFGLFAIYAGVTLSRIERPFRPVAFVLLVLAPAGLINIVGGQNGFLSAVLLLGGMLLLDRRPVLAGILFGLLTYKPHLGLVVPFVLLALGAWRTIAAATVTAMALCACSLAVFGFEPWRAYFEVTAAFQILLLERFSDFGVYMLTSVMGAARTFGFSLRSAFALQLAVAIPVLACAVWAVRQTADPARRAFVLVAATMLATPYALVYDLPALTAVMAWQLCRPQSPGLGRTLIFLAAWLAPIGAIFLNNWGLALTPIALTGVFALAVREAAGSRRPALRPAGWNLYGPDVREPASVTRR
jgi:hypothetical protein